MFQNRMNHSWGRKMSCRVSSWYRPMNRSRRMTRNALWKACTGSSPWSTRADPNTLRADDDDFLPPSKLLGAGRREGVLGQLHSGKVRAHGHANTRHLRRETTMGDVIQGHAGDLTLAVLRGFGVDTMFTLNGGHVWPFYDAARKQGVPIVDTRHEQTATFAAEAYAKLTRTPG